MVMRKTNPGLVQQQQAPLNSGSEKFLPAGVNAAKPMKVGPDPHAQAKRDGAGYANTAKHVVKSPCSAADLLESGE
jgi:hypothetical protein